MQMYPSIEAKAAYLFYHLTTSHVFSNGNKRTAVLCLDTFLLQNGRYLLLDNDQMYKLARLVARSGEKGLRPAQVLQRVRRILAHNAPPFSALRKFNEKLYRKLHRHKRWLRQAPKNQPGHPICQLR